MIRVSTMGRFSSSHIKVEVLGYKDSYAWDSMSEREVDELIKALQKSKQRYYREQVQLFPASEDT